MASVEMRFGVQVVRALTMTAWWMIGNIQEHGHAIVWSKRERDGKMPTSQIDETRFVECFNTHAVILGHTLRTGRISEIGIVDSLTFSDANGRKLLVRMNLLIIIDQCDHGGVNSISIDHTDFRCESHALILELTHLTVVSGRAQTSILT